MRYAIRESDEGKTPYGAARAFYLMGHDDVKTPRERSRKGLCEGFKKKGKELQKKQRTGKEARRADVRCARQCGTNVSKTTHVAICYTLAPLAHVFAHTLARKWQRYERASRVDINRYIPRPRYDGWFRAGQRSTTSSVPSFIIRPSIFSSVVERGQSTLRM